MEHLDRPDEITWDERRLWFEAREAEIGRGGAGTLSEQACALIREVARSDDGHVAVTARDGLDGLVELDHGRAGGEWGDERDETRRRDKTDPAFRWGGAS